MFLLDFYRPVEKIRWLGIKNRVFGPTIALLVPVVHVGEKAGAFVFGVSRGEPYFEDIPNLWRKHRAFPRVPAGEALDGLQFVANLKRRTPWDF